MSVDIKQMALHFPNEMAINEVKRMSWTYLTQEEREWIAFGLAQLKDAGYFIEKAVAEDNTVLH